MDLIRRLMEVLGPILVAEEDSYDIDPRRYGSNPDVIYGNGVLQGRSELADELKEIIRDYV